MENKTQSAVPILSNQTGTSNAGTAEEIGYILWVCCLAFFFLLLQVKRICLNQFKWSKKAKTERGMENFFQLQHKQWKSKDLTKKTILLGTSLQKTQRRDKEKNCF